ncbi:MAG TPA: glycosyltransferase [Acidimicrobiales bacterium]
MVRGGRTAQGGGSGTSTMGPAPGAPEVRSVRPDGLDRAPVPRVGSVVIPARDEAAVIGRGLDRLLRSLGRDVEVVVVCNGCADDTAAVARRRGRAVTVIEVDVASKERALRTADHRATVFPRVYLDADVLVSGTAVRAVLAHLAGPGALAARPPLVYDTSASSWPVRRFYRARAELPSVMGRLWGAGFYALSAAARRRFDEFPLGLADDLFVDRLFRTDEIALVDTEPVVVVAPATLAGLLATFRRTFRRNRALDREPAHGLAAAQPAGSVERAGRTAACDRPGTRATVRELVRLACRGPDRFADAAVYAGVVAAARVLARRHPPGSRVWERDETSRR